MFTGHTVLNHCVQNPHYYAGFKNGNRTLTFKGLFFLRLHIWLLLALWLPNQIFLFAFRRPARQDQTGPVRQIQTKRKGCGRWMWVQAAGTALGRCCQVWRGFRSTVGLLKVTVWHRLAGLLVILYLFLLSAFFPGFSCFCELEMLKWSVPHLRLQNV